MKRYSFKLESLLSLRENIEKEWEAKLGKANSECEIVKNRIEELKERLNNSKMMGVDINNFHVQSLYQQRLDQQIDNQTSVLMDKERVRDEVKATYLKKSIDRKVIDKLKEKSRTRYHKEMLKEDIKFIDELNSASKIRESMLGGLS